MCQQELSFSLPLSSRYVDFAVVNETEDLNLFIIIWAMRLALTEDLIRRQAKAQRASH